MEGTAGGRADRNSTGPARLLGSVAVCVQLRDLLGHRCPRESLFFPRGMYQDRCGGERGLGDPRSRQQPRGVLFGGSRGGRGPIPHLPEDAVSSRVRRTRTSVQCAVTAGSSSAVTAVPGPSTWPACPHPSGRFPGEPAQLPSTSFAGPLPTDPEWEDTQKPFQSTDGK